MKPEIQESSGWCITIIVILFTCTVASLLYFSARVELLCLARSPFLNTGSGQFAIYLLVTLTAVGVCFSVSSNRFRRSSLPIRLASRRVAFAVFLLVSSLMLNLNTLLDESSEFAHSAVVMGKTFSLDLARSTPPNNYYLRVTSWEGKAEPIIVRVDKQDFDRIRPDMPLTVFTRPGYFGIEWISRYGLSTELIIPPTKSVPKGRG